MRNRDYEEQTNIRAVERAADVVGRYEWLATGQNIERIYRNKNGYWINPVDSHGGIIYNSYRSDGPFPTLDAAVDYAMAPREPATLCSTCIRKQVPGDYALPESRARGRCATCLRTVYLYSLSNTGTVRPTAGQRSGDRHCAECDRPEVCDIIKPATAPCGRNGGLVDG